MRYYGISDIPAFNSYDRERPRHVQTLAELGPACSEIYLHGISSSPFSTTAEIPGPENPTCLEMQRAWCTRPHNIDLRARFFHADIQAYGRG